MSYFPLCIIKDETSGKFLTSGRILHNTSTQKLIEIESCNQDDFMKVSCLEGLIPCIESHLRKAVGDIFHEILQDHSFKMGEVKKDVDFTPLELINHEFRIYQLKDGKSFSVSEILRWKGLIQDIIQETYQSCIVEDGTARFNLFLFRDLVEENLRGKYFTTKEVIYDPEEIKGIERWEKGKAEMFLRFSYHAPNVNTKDDEMMFKLSTNADKLKEINVADKVRLWNKFLSYDRE